MQGRNDGEHPGFDIGRRITLRRSAIEKWLWICILFPDLQGEQGDKDKVLNVEIKQSDNRCDAAQQAVSTLRRAPPDGNWFNTAIGHGKLRCARQVDAPGYIAQSARLAGTGAPGPGHVRERQPLHPIADVRDLVAPPTTGNGHARDLRFDINTLDANLQFLPVSRNLGVPLLSYHLGANAEHPRVSRDACCLTGVPPSGAIYRRPACRFLRWR